MMGDKRAKECYELFQEIRSRFHSPEAESIKEGSPLHGIVHDFDKFVMLVDSTKKEIEHAKTIHK